MALAITAVTSAGLITTVFKSHAFVQSARRSIRLSDVLVIVTLILGGLAIYLSLKGKGEKSLQERIDEVEGKSEEDEEEDDEQ